MLYDKKSRSVHIILCDAAFVFNAVLPPDWEDINNLMTKTLFIHTNSENKASVEHFFNLLKTTSKNDSISILYNARLCVVEHVEMILHITVGNTETIRDDTEIVIEWNLNVLARIDMASLIK